MKTTALTTLGLLGFLAGGSAQAISIDTFNTTPAQELSTAPTSTTWVSVSDVSGPHSTDDVIGGYRDILLNSRLTSDQGQDRAFVDVNLLDSDTLNVTNGTRVISEVVVTWDADGFGLGGVDLLDGTGDPDAYAFIVDVLTIDAPGADIKVELSDSSSTASASRNFESEDNALFFIPFSGFVDAAGFDFGAVTKISMTLSSPNPGWDLVIAGVRTDEIPEEEQIPLPGTLALIGAGLVAVAFRRRKRA